MRRKEENRATEQRSARAGKEESVSRGAILPHAAIAGIRTVDRSGTGDFPADGPASGSSVFARVCELVQEACALPETTLAAETKIDELSLDSLSFVVLLVNCENEFGISFAEEEWNWENWQTVGQLVRRTEELNDERQDREETAGHRPL